MARITVERIDPERSAHRISIGQHALIADMGAGDGGDDEGPDPHDLYDAALGACKALTMVWYANRKGIALRDVHVEIERDTSAQSEGIYKLTARIAIDGPMDEAERDKLIEIAGRCPVEKLMTQLQTQIETIALPRG